MWKLTVPEDVLEKLRCSLCKEYLSQLPVYSYPNHEGVGCGRCPVLSDQNPIRNVAYEEVAKHLLFPCRFKIHGCSEQILPNQMLVHEESCGYKQYFCPLIPLGSCTWQGASSELYMHYEDRHKILTLQESNPRFEVDLINMYEDNYVLTSNGDLFLVHIKCDANEHIFWGCVRYIGIKKIAKQYCYQIELKASNSLERILLGKKIVECDTSIVIDKSVAVSIDTNQIKSELGNPCSILCCINISQNVTPDNLIDLISETSINKDSEVDEKLLGELECPVCNEHMVPPIYQCNSGHSICGNCRPNIKKCPTCRIAVEEIRNYGLEKLTRFIKYNCKFRDYGCQFVSSAEDIRNHENFCKLGLYDCPFTEYNHCKWRGGISNIMQHAKSEHEDNIMHIEIVTFIFADNGEDSLDDDCFICNVSGDLFRLVFKYEDDSFFWSVQYIGPPEEASNFLYELDIIDNSGSEQRFFVRKVCSPLTKYADSFNNEHPHLSLPVELLRPFINKKDLIYKCHIFKRT